MIAHLLASTSFLVYDLWFQPATGNSSCENRKHMQEDPVPFYIWKTNYLWSIRKPSPSLLNKPISFNAQDINLDRFRYYVMFYFVLMISSCWYIGYVRICYIDIIRKCWDWKFDSLIFGHVVFLADRVEHLSYSYNEINTAITQV